MRPDHAPNSNKSESAVVRAEAARVVAAVVAGESLDRMLPGAAEASLDPSLIRLLSYGTLRWYPRLDRLLALLLDRPMRARDADVRALALVGLYQLIDTDIAAHAAVAETVEATKILGKPRAAGLLNALLRRFQRERAGLLALVDDTETGRFAHPAWLIERLRADWPEDWQRILAAGNQPPPMWLRVNRRLTTTAEYLGRLAGHGHEAHPSALAPDALRLERPMAVEALPGFDAGLVSVQDAGPQLARNLLDAGAGMRVLDACAAPGGKTCHILESCPGLGEMLALDRSAERLARLRENLARLGLTATLRAADATDVGRWWDGEAFDRILLDAPCSATGVIRRHPDIKLLRRPADIGRYAARQEALLEALWPLLAQQGKLLYATCSILQQENAGVTGKFLEGHPDARGASGFNRTNGVEWGHESGVGVQILPGEADMDGFYYACLAKAG
ncbi:MAG: 16S rRNA (cytosine(967)-C(5))-methyltransferase RsmB [Gammaproteobacteria bacterium]|nr:16S rRNA (cytosine(967)-C(5))-methyltransferase RsmB [Gammaproteobacteria bacterium]